MKKLIILLLLFSVGVQAQVIDLTPFAKKTDLQAIEVRLKALENGGIVVTNPGCKRGPTIGKITEVTSRGALIEWDGKDVTNLKYTVSGMGKMYVDSIKPTESKIHITFPAEFPNGDYKVIFEGLNCTGISNGQFTIAGGIDPPSSQDCKGKRISFKIKGFTNQSATIQFDAEGLTDLTLSLVQDTKIIASKPYHPDGNTLYFPFSNVQPAGNYKIKLTPISCKADAIYQEFTIKDEDSGTVDPPVTDPGTYKYSIISKGLDDHLNITKTTSGDIAILNDISRPDLNPEYEFRYMINSEIIKSTTPLTNYRLAGHNPFRIWKMKTKIGLETVNKWGNGMEHGGWYDENAGASFWPNITAGLETGVFQGPQVASGFLNHIPQSYDASKQHAQWADISPDLKLPKGRFFFLNRGQWPIDQVLQKGVTHISHHQIPRPGGDESLAVKMKQQGITYNDVPTIPILFQLGDTGIDSTEEGFNKRYWTPETRTEKYAIDQANRIAFLDAFWIGETTEGPHYMPMDKTNPWKPYYRTIKQNMERQFGSKGIPYEICHTYLYLTPNEITLGRDYKKDDYKRFAAAAPEDMPRSPFTPGGALTETTLIVDPIYLGAPDIVQDALLKSVYKMQVWQRLGYKTGIFITGVQDWRPNNFVEYTYPDGKWYNNEKIPLDPNVVIASSFLSQAFGTVYVDWGDHGSSKNFKKFDPQYMTGLWYPTGSTSPQTNLPAQYSQPGSDYYGYNGAVDLSRFGLQLWNDTYGQLDGGLKQYLKYRIDGGDWFAGSNNYSDEVVDCFYDKRGFVHSISKGSRIAWFYYNPFADNKYHTIDVQFPSGKTVSQRVAGNGVHAKIEGL